MIKSNLAGRDTDTGLGGKVMGKKAPTFETILVLCLGEFCDVQIAVGVGHRRFLSRATQRGTWSEQTKSGPSSGIGTSPFQAGRTWVC